MRAGSAVNYQLPTTNLGDWAFWEMEIGSWELSEATA
jgi:hypothetical protein